MPWIAWGGVPGPPGYGPATVAQLLQPSLAFCFSLQPMRRTVQSWTVIGCKLKQCRTCFEFYCMFYFTCDRSLKGTSACSKFIHEGWIMTEIWCGCYWRDIKCILTSGERCVLRATKPVSMASRVAAAAGNERRPGVRCSLPGCRWQPRDNACMRRWQPSIIGGGVPNPQPLSRSGNFCQGWKLV